MENDEELDLRLCDGILESIVVIARRDPEAAHDMEDTFHAAVLKRIAGGVPYGQKLAAKALETEKIEFEKWAA